VEGGAGGTGADFSSRRGTLSETTHLRQALFQIAAPVHSIWISTTVSDLTIDEMKRSILLVCKGKAVVALINFARAPKIP